MHTQYYVITELEASNSTNILVTKMLSLTVSKMLASKRYSSNFKTVQGHIIDKEWYSLDLCVPNHKILHINQQTHPEASYSKTYIITDGWIGKMKIRTQGRDLTFESPTSISACKCPAHSYNISNISRNDI